MLGKIAKSQWLFKRPTGSWILNVRCYDVPEGSCCEDKLCYTQWKQIPQTHSIAVPPLCHNIIAQITCSLCSQGDGTDVNYITDVSCIMIS